ncbi:MAG: hypothetical protein ACFB50_12160 [Rubrobacteraceae bacterium]
MTECFDHTSAIDELRLANLLRAYDELERELAVPDPLLSSYLRGKPTHNCNGKCCAEPVRQELLYRADSMAEYEAHAGRWRNVSRLREKQQRILYMMAEEGLPESLWVNVGKDPIESSSTGGRFIRLDFEEGQEQSSAVRKYSRADPKEPSGRPGLPAVLSGQRYRLYSVRAEALDAIPLEARPEDVVGISERLERLDRLDANTRSLFDWYEKALPVLGAALLTLPPALYYALGGSLLPISVGVVLAFSLLSCLAVVAAYLIVRDKDYRVGPAGIRDKRIMLWKRYRHLNPAQAAAHHDAAQAATRITQRRTPNRREIQPKEQRKD